MRRINIKSTQLYLNIIQLKEFIRKLHIIPALFILPAFLTLVASLFEGVSIGLLIPVAEGILKGSFTSVTGLKILKIPIGRFFNLFNISEISIFLVLLSVVFLASLLKNILQYFATMIISYQAQRFCSNTRKLIFERYLKFGKLFFDRTSMGYLNQLITSFSYAISNQIMFLEGILSASFMLIVYIIVMLTISWKLTLFVMLIIPTLNYSSRWLSVKIRKTSGLYAESLVSLGNNIFNMLSCISLIKLYNTEETEKRRFDTISDNVANLEFSMAKKYHLIAPLQDSIMLIIQLLLLSAMVLLLAEKGRQSQLPGFLIFLYVLRRASASLGIFSQIGATVAVTSGPMSDMLKIFNDSDKFFIPEGEREFGGLKRSIELRNLSFSYIKKVPVLKEIGFFIEKGKMTAIVGPTGAGKTTIINLILRFYDFEPSTIFIDGIDIREFSLQSLRARMALVSQDPLLFNDTIRFNIAYGLDNVTEQGLIETTEKARLYDFIKSLPEGFDTYVGDRGVKLSGGEKQRLSIARALLKKAEILILDEATSSLDTKTELLIQEAISEAVKDRTTIVIAHRLSTIKNADKILVIENGRLIEQGALKELLEKKGKFYEYWEAQKFY